jgi:ribosomal protein S1
MNLTIVAIDKERRRVKLSNLSAVEAEITKQLGVRSKNSKIEVEATVAEVREDGMRSFVLATSKPEQAIFLMVNAFASTLRNVDQLSSGDKSKVTVLRKTNKLYSTNLNRLPEQVRKQLERKNAIPNLNWKRGVLSYEGHLDYGMYRSLLELSKDVQYQDALSRIWWLSNRLTLVSVYNKRWVEQTSAEISVGDDYKAEITSFTKGGIALDVHLRKKVIKGYVPKANVLDGRIHDLEKFFEDLSMHVTVRVMEIKGDEELLCAIPFLKDDPILKIGDGDEIRGKVTGIKDFGVFVELRPGVEGLIGGRGIGDLDTSELKVGQSITVQVYEIDTTTRKINLDFLSL